MEKKQEIKGKVVSIIYYNDKNTYSIFLFHLDEKTITCTGNLPFIKLNDKYILYGQYVEHNVYGKQFKFDTFEKILPSTEEELISYLSSGAIKGLGEKTAERIIAEFGDKSIEVIKSNPEKISKIKGISLNKAEELQKIVNEEWYFLQLVKFLNPYGINNENISKIYKEYQSKAIDLINENPYLILDIVENVDFSYVDKIASDLEFEIVNINRIKYGVKYTLLKNFENGNTCLLYEKLLTAVSKFLHVDLEYIENAIIEMKVENEIEVETRKNNEEYVYLARINQIENMVANKIKSMLNENEKRVDISDRIKVIEKKLELTLTDMQRKAIEIGYNNNISVITGGPGTGKTTIIQCLMKLFLDDEKNVSLCAPTGRAAKRITEVTGYEAKTIHRLLDLTKIEERIDKLQIKVEQLKTDVVILDEASMLDTIIFGFLIKALTPGTKLILIGDVNQLPAVGAGDILNDLIKCKDMNCIYLNEIFRQAKESLIVVNAHKVNNGIYPDLDIKDKDMFYINNTDNDSILNEIVDLCKYRLNSYITCDSIKDIQVIDPTKKGDIGTRNLNKFLQGNLNPKSNEKAEKVYGQTIFRIGDKVMQVKNNYDLEWEKNGFEGQGVYNGDMGYVTQINNADNIVQVTFDDGKVSEYTNSVLEELEHAYAITVHKSQGSEFDIVILPIIQGPPMLYTRNLLYTAITRAKKMLVIIGDKQIVDKMVDNVRNNDRSTGLEYKLNY